ncbi:MAG: hypothetical protein O3C60_19780 [Planctomycetota bacterium]|nr:hypothetical protein [Planctomycetota bacterium]
MSDKADYQRPQNAGTGELPPEQQRKNCFVFAISQILAFCAAPVSQVAVLHAPIIHSLGNSDTISNLPDAIALCTLPFPVILLWFWRSDRSLRPLLVASYLIRAIADLATGCLIAVAPPTVWTMALVAHAAVIETTGGTINMCLWELIGSGIGPDRRGRTLSITFGLGPLFAILAAGLSQLALTGDFVGLVRTTRVPHPWAYVAMFTATGLVMSLAALVT